MATAEIPMAMMVPKTVKLDCQTPVEVKRDRTLCVMDFMIPSGLSGITMKKKLLVIGGSGFLGHHLVKALMEASFQVAVASPTNSSHSKIESHRLDLLNYSQLKEVAQNFQIIVNCTGQITDPIQDCLLLNMHGSQNLSRLGQETGKKIVHISTTHIYGTATTVTETSAINPQSPYATCKAFADLQIQTLPPQQILIIRLSNLYGPQQQKGLMPFLLRSLGQQIQFTDNDGSLLRHFLHVTDAAFNITQLLKKEATGIFNLAGPEKLTLTQLIALVEKVTQTKYKAKFTNQAPIDNITNISNQKVAQQISLKFNHSITSYLQENTHQHASPKI